MSLVSRLASAVEQLFITTEPAVVEQKQRRKAKNILWREWRHCNDAEYCQHLVGLISDVAPHHELRGQERPLAGEVETALRLAGQLWPQTQAAWTDSLRLLDEERQQPASPTQLVADLQSSDWVRRFVARHTLSTLGGEAAAPVVAAVAADERSSVRDVAIWLLRSIEAETRDRLSAHSSRLLCPRCLVRFYANEVLVTDLPPFVYYGCRACGQSREFLEWPDEVVTVLDKGMDAAYIEQDGLLRGNWLQFRSLFDCDWVEIIQATDEDVERFAVQVGNDTDLFRKPHYQTMPCLVNPKCRLSDNTLRILEHIFGEVKNAPII